MHEVTREGKFSQVWDNFSAVQEKMLVPVQSSRVLLLRVQETKKSFI